MTSKAEIVVASDTRSAMSAIQRGVIDPLEDVVELLEQVGDDGKGAGKDLEKGMRDAQRRTDDAKDEIRQLRDELNKAGRSGKSAGRDIDDGMRDASDSIRRVEAGAREVQMEVGQNLGQAVSTVRGDLSELGQVGQDTLGGLAATVASMGPGGLLGALALAAGAVGLGAVTAGLTEAKERQEKLNEEAGKWAAAYEASAGRIVSAAYTVGEVLAIQNDTERFNDAKKAAQEWGVEVPTAMRAIAGDATALALVQDALTKKTSEYESTLSDAQQNVGELGEAFRTTNPEIEDGWKRFSLLNDAMAMGQEQARAGARALYDLTVATGVATGETDDLGNAIYKLPDGKEIVVDAVTKQAHEDLDALESRPLSRKTVAVDVVVDDTNWRKWQPSPKTGRIAPAVQGSRMTLE